METKHARRLLKLADLLDTVPRKHFDFSSWFDGREEDKSKAKPELLRAGWCGTKACALGWAATTRVFKDNGFCVKYGYFFNKSRNAHEHASDVSGRLYGLTDLEHSYLFVSGYKLTTAALSRKNGVTPKDIAKSIRRFVKDHYTGKAKLC